MGNVLAQCQRCSVAQCDLCSEVVPGLRRRQDPDQIVENPSTSSAPPANAGRGPAWAAGFTSQDYQPADMTEAELIALAQRRSWADAGLSPPQPPDATGRQRLIDAADLGVAPPIRQTDDEMLLQCIRASEIEEARELRDEQTREYEESLRIDREKQKKLREDEQKRQEEERTRQEAEDFKFKQEADAKAKEKDAVEELRARITTLMEEARMRLSEEPAAEEPDRVIVRIRTPEGKALKRAFRATDEVNQVYDYTVVEGGEVLASQAFRLISTMPRCVYEERAKTLQAAGLQGQCALLVEIIESDDEGAEEGNAKS